MCKRLFCLTSLVVMLGVVGVTRAELIGHWALDETSGSTAADFSGRQHHGTYVNSPGLDVPGVYGTGMDAAGGYMEVDLGADLPIQAEERTITLWVSTAQVRGDLKFCAYGNMTNGEGFTFCIENVNAEDGVRMRHWGGNMFYAGFITGQWNHLAMRVPAGATIVNDTEVFINGQNIPGYRSGGSDQPLITAATPFYVGTSIGTQTGQVFDGLLDDVYFYDHALSEAEILGVMEGQPWPYAFGPEPANGAMHENTWVNLMWKPGDLAVSHDVYLGDNFDDVNAGTGDTFRGNLATPSLIAGFPGYPFPGGLVPGTTYYWRIDEVNDANPDSPWKGDIWSFTVPAQKAYNPGPADGLRFVDPNTTLSWTAGLNAKVHYAYFGDNFDDVNNATAGLVVTATSYTPPGPPQQGKTYYWRVDEFDGAATHKGDVWSFETRPFMAISDPNLVCRWTLDEGEGRDVLDWSGHGNNAQFTGNPRWAEGYVGAALNFNGSGDSVIYRFSDQTWPAYTVAVWVKADMVSQSNNSCILATYGSTAGGLQFSFDAGNSYQYHAGVDQIIGSASLSWVHLAVTYDGTTATAYYKGDPVATFTPPADDLMANKFAIGVNRAEDNWFDGAIDDFRVYNRALTQQEVQLAMRIDPLLAWNPSPVDGSTHDIEHITPLTWLRGDKATQHEVYFGLDKAAVANADASDTAGVYRGAQSATSYTPAEGLAWGGGPYFWRVDEDNNEGTVTKGRIWSFTVGDFLVVDNMESYNDVPETDPGSNRIYLNWIDGFGTTTNGAFVGNLDVPLTERGNIHGGVQAMPLSYDNNLKFSEATLTLTAGNDWTRQGVTEL
ncbi:MAG TPA: LamG-like jellyroll fold domain-containing protein, partial [Sedimentisphaerales bacterium]|nr:LamG-like jellyroll fold domain-containing protein [Sedimentisphaerales bacterium]